MRSTLEIIGFLNNIISNNTVKNIIIQGDLNIQFENIQSKCARAFKTFLESHNIVDTYRELCPDTVSQKGNTYPQKGNNNPTRIDYILMSRNLFMRSKPIFTITPHTLLNTDHNLISLSNNTRKNSFFTYPFDNKLLEQDYLQSKIVQSLKSCLIFEITNHRSFADSGLVRETLELLELRELDAFFKKLNININIETLYYYIDRAYFANERKYRFWKKNLIKKKEDFLIRKFNRTANEKSFTEEDKNDKLFEINKSILKNHNTLFF